MNNFTKHFKNKKKISNSKILKNKTKLGILSKENAYLYKYQYKAIYMSLRRLYKNKIYIQRNFNFITPITFKSSAARMGKGKGKIYTKIAKISKNQIFLEIYGLNNLTNKKEKQKVYKLLNKLPFLNKIFNMKK